MFLAVPFYSPLVAALAFAYRDVSPWTLPLFFGPALAAQRLFGLYQEARRSAEDLSSANRELMELAERVRKTHRDTIASLARSMEAKDYYTGGHTERVANLARTLAARLGFEGEDLEAVEVGALLHDIGKIGIPEVILHKPGPLDDAEWKVMKEHPVVSEYILSGIELLHPFVAQIARSSHERMDGKGYPDGKAGERIPLPARIVFVADAFDALTSDRPYRNARSCEDAVEELRRHAGTQFCPKVIAAFEQVIAEEPDLVVTAERLARVA